MTWLPFVTITIIDSKMEYACYDVHMVAFYLLLLTCLVNPIAFGAQSKEIRITVIRMCGVAHIKTNISHTDVECKVDYNDIDQEFRAYAVDENGIFCPSPSMDQVRRRLSFDVTSLAEEMEKNEISDLAIAGYDDEYYHAPTLLPPGISAAQIHLPTKKELSSLENGCDLKCKAPSQRINVKEVSNTVKDDGNNPSPTFSADTQQSELND